MKKILLAVFACLLVFVSGCTIAGGRTTPGCFAGLGGGDNPDDQKAVDDLLKSFSIAAMIVFFVIAIAYALGEGLHKPEWVAWAKTELWLVLAGLLMLGMVTFIATLSCSVSMSIAGDDPYKIADKYLTGLVSTKMIPAVLSFFDKSFSAQKASSILIGVTSCMVGICFSPFAGYSGLSYNMDTLAGLVTPITASLLFQKLALQFIQQTMFLYVLPIGFLLRVFPYTRDAGAMLIALAMGFYIVFPLTYVFNKVAMDAAEKDFVNFCAGNPGGLDGISTSMIGGMCYPLVTVGSVLPQAVFMPALNLIITVTFMRSAQKVFSKDYLAEGL
ncbi:hypothetical protein HY992_00265 [Candidatus Micrarchaeota archaeon]|nr:hypothetical protein [Candidatus Micrarchaeota archaeon]